MVTMDVDNMPDASLNVSTVSAPSKEMNELQYSRLIYTLGREAVNILHHSKVLVIGCKALGAEVAKNLVLSGVHALGLVDDEVVATADLGAQFLLSEADVGRNRAGATAHRLKEMYPSVEIVTLATPALDGAIGSYGVVVATAGSVLDLIHFNSLCRSSEVPFVAASCRGVFSFVFVDFGDSFAVVDETGEPAGSILVEGITQDFPATVTVVEEQRHGLEDGDEVVFSGIKGMEELNRSAPYPVTVAGVNSFTIQEDTRPFNRYLSGGYFSKLKPAKNVECLSLERALVSPKFCISDPVKASRSMHLHAAFQAIDEYERRHTGDARSPPGSTAVSDEEVEEVIALAREIWANSDFGETEKGSSNGSFAMEDATEGREEEAAEGALKGVVEGEVNNADRAGCSGDGSNSGMAGTSAVSLTNLTEVSHGKRIELDEEIVLLLVQGSHVELCPITAVTGGIAAQEAMKVSFFLCSTF